MADKSRGSTVLSPNGASSVPTSTGGGPPKFRYEEIIKEISALDEMLEQYNDTSLPYITEFETSCGDSLQPTTDEIAVTDSQLPVSAVHVVPHQKQQQAHSQSSSVSNLVAVNDNSSIILPETVLHSSSSSTSSPMNGNKVVDQNQNLDWSEERVEGRNNNGPIIHTSHLIQIPVVEQPPAPTNGTFKAHSNTRTFHSVSTSTSSSTSSSSSSAGEMNGNSIHNSNSSNNERHQHQPKRKGKGSGGDGGATTTSSVPASGGGTYSKGTSYEILIPKITSGSFISRDSSISSGKGTVTTSSHSNRASIMVPVIESQDTSNNTQNGGKVRPQLNMGIFQPTSSSQDASSSQGTNVQVHTKDIHTTHVPVSEAGGAETSETHVGGVVIENNGELVDMNQQNHSNSKYSKGANGNGSVSSTYITVSEGKSSLGQSSSGTVSSAVMMMMMRGDEEQWNFPSEKNLPRSLRKTRKTCFLDEGEQGDGKLRARAESPYYEQSNGVYASSDHSVSSSDQCNYVGDVNGRNGSCHKSPRVMPRKGIPSKCEIINKGDGNFALEGPNKQIWNGLQNQQPQQHHQPHTTIVSTSSLSSGSKEMGRSDRKKIYEDVVLRSQAASSDKLKKPGSAHHSAVANNSSPSSTFTSSSGVSLSVRSNPTLDEEPIQRGKSSNHHHPGKPRKGYHHHHNELQQQQQQQVQTQQQPAPKPRVRQQIPSPGTEVPVPGTNLVTPQNQFIPSLANGRQSHHQDPYQSQISCTPITMSSHHSPDPVEIGTEEAHRDEPQHFAGRDIHLSSTSSPIKICHPHSLIKSCVDAKFGEIGDNLGKTGGDKAKARRGGSGRKGELNHSMSGFEPVGQEDSNGSLPNQSQMMRMMMMMKSSAKNSVGSASSSSRSSSSSGSVSVKSSSSSSENNCADVFHENIVQDYPTNIFNVAAAVADQDARSGGGSPRGRKVSKEETSCKLIDEIGIVNTNAEKSNGGGGVNNAVVVMRAKISGSARGNLQQNANQTGNKKNGNGGGNNSGGSANQGNNSTLDIDDGYLSMINRNEAPLLWPEEFIENETFSRDEMKRLSVHLNDDETDDGGSSNSHSPPHPKTNQGGEKEGSSPNKSEFAKCRPSRNSMSGSSSNTSSGHEQNRRNRRERAHVPGRSSTEKTDYFSDDSLEMEGDEEMLLQSCSDNIKTNGSGKPGNSTSPTSGVVRPSTSFIIPFNTKDDDILKVEPVESQPRKEGKVSQIRKSNSQVSRIPKMVSPASSNRRSSAGNNVIQKRESFTKVSSSHSGGSSPTSGFPKPCSFFIPFSAESQNSDGNGAVTKMSASTGDNYVVNSAVSVNVPSARSTSLPSSRRNSSASSSENKVQHGHHAAIAWNISSSPDNDIKLRQQQAATKASAPDNYLIDSRNKSEAVGAASHPSNNVGEQLNGLKKEEEKVTVDADGSISIDGANKLDSDEINPSATTTSNTNSSGGAKTGDSMSKRAKFQKQQTFLVSPSSRETTTSSDGHGQRLIDPDNQSTTPSQDTALLLTVATTHQNEQCNNNDLTPDKTATTEPNQLTLMDNNNKENDSSFRSQTDQESFEGKVRNVKDRVNVNGEEMQNARAKANCDPKKMRMELNSSSAIGHDDNHSPPNYTSRNYTSSDNVVVVNGGNSWEFDGKQQGFDKSVEEEEDNQNKLLENQESVAEELESVVKMFLKATADLLHPEEEDKESASTKGKSESDSCGNLKCEPGRVSLGDSHDDSQKQASVVIECNGDDDDDGIMLSKLKDYENGFFNPGESGNVQELLTDNISSLSDVAAKQPLMTSTPLADRSSRSGSERKKRRELDGTSPIVRKENSSSAIGGDKRLSFLMLPETTDEEEPVIEDLHEQPPAFIPEPPPVDVIAPIRIVAPPHANIVDTSSTSSSSIHPNHLHNLEGKVALDLLSQRITRKCPSPVENMSVSQFLHNKKNIWAMYDRPYDEDVLPPSFPRGFASRSQENLVDAMTHERLTKSFSARGQSSTLPLNCRPPPVQRRTSTFRNMFNKFRKHKTTDSVIPEGPEIRDEEAQSITSRETGPSEGKKRGFFSRLFRRSRKH